VDKRTDIWAFGVVLYELLTGQRAFKGETMSDSLAGILAREPDWSALPPGSPMELLRRCLEKDPRKRLRDMGDLELAAAPAPVAAATATEKRQSLPWIAAGAFALLVLVLVVWNMRPAPAPAVRRVVVPLEAGQRFPTLNQPVLALSPNGNYLVYVASQAGVQQLYLRPLESFQAVPMPGTESAISPFFSPDSQSIGFFAGGKLKKIPVSGGSPVNICDAAGPFPGASWGTGDVIVFHTLSIGSFQQVSAAGGQRQALRTVKNEIADRWPSFLPGINVLLFNAAQSTTYWDETQIRTYALKTGEQHDLPQSGAFPRFSPSGHLLYGREGTLMAAPFDVKRLELTGAAVPVVEGVAQSATTGVAQYNLSDNGELAYVPGSIQANKQTLVWVDRRGAEQPIAAPARAYRNPRLSPDGRRVVFTLDDHGGTIAVYDLVRETLTRLTSDGVTPTWAPDGQRIVWHPAGSSGLFWQPADGSGKPERLTTSEFMQVPNSFAPDAQTLAFVENNPTTGQDIWVLRLSDRKATPFLKTPANETAPKFSPDGHWLAYTSDESGSSEIYVLPYPGPGGKWQVSGDGGTEAVWNPSGRELFYRHGSKIMAVDVTTGSSFSAGKPKLLFDGPYLPTPATFQNYDVSRDGQRFLMLKASAQEQAPTQINVVLNWFEELKRRVPAK